MEFSSEKGILKSRVKYRPQIGNNGDVSNMARELRAAFKRHSNRTLLVDASQQGAQFTGAQLYDTTGRIASALIKRAHLEPDQVVLTMCEHSGSEVLLALGIVLAGGALFGSTADGDYEEEKVLCELVRPDVIVVGSKLHQLAIKLKQNLVGLKETRIIWIDNPLKQFASLNSSSTIPDTNNNNNGSNDSFTYYTDLIERDQVLLFDDLIKAEHDEQLVANVSETLIDSKRHHLTYMLTSGSTGRPKVVPNTHEELVHGIYSMISANTYPIGSNDTVSNGFGCDENNNTEESTSPNERMLMRISPDSVLAGDLPLDHGAGVNTMFMSIHIGSKLVIMPSYQVDTFWQAVDDFRITASIASTTFTYKLLVRLKELITANKTQKYDLSSLKFISCAGSKLTFKDLIAQVNEVYKHIRVSQCYGATEIGFMCMLSAEECRQHLDSVGHLMPGLLAKVVEPETGRVLGPHERGELRIWANSKFKGYKCHASEDAQSLLNDCHDEQGFYKTGDQVHYDSDGRLYIHGRFKETLFLMEDWKILPAELEELVDQHPLVERSAVIGVPDAELAGCDAPKAFVKLISSGSGDFKRLSETDKWQSELKRILEAGDLESIAHDIYQFVAQRTSEPKHLKGGVRILAEFPTVGLLNKVDRKALKLLN